jgi:hypothetical protein
MTRPRSQQINDPATRYTSFPLRVLPTAGDLVTSIVGSDFTALLNTSITQTLGGSEEALPAILTANGTDPYPLSIGQQIDIRVDGSAPVTVILTASEFVTLNSLLVATGHRLVALINTTLASVNPSWANVASRTNDGFLRLTSPTTGVSSSVQISAFPAIMSALGFGVVNSASAAGQGLTRGIITKSLDALGGFVFPSYSDGRKVLATSNSTYDLSSASLTNDINNNIPSGAPLIGRLVSTPAPSADIYWNAKCTGSPVIRSSFSDFTTLTGADILEINFFDPSTNTTLYYACQFVPPINDVSDVVNQLNNGYLYANKAKIVSTIGEPFYAFGNFDFSLNGQAPISVSINNTTFQANDIVTLINTAIIIAGQGAEGVASVVGNQQIKIESLLPVNGGPTSSVEILSSSNPELLRSLGFPVTKRVGWHIGRQVGAEIEISHPNPSVRVSILNTSVGLSKLGLSSYPVSPNVVPVEEKLIPCGFPSLQNASAYLPSEYAVNLLIPELMEAGDIPDDNFTKTRLDDHTSLDSAAFPSLSTNAEDYLSQARYGILGTLDSLRAPISVTSMNIGSVSFPKVDSSNTPYVTYPYDYTISNNPTILAFNADTSLRFYTYSVINTPIIASTINADAVFGTVDFTPDFPGYASSISTLKTDSFAISFRDAAAPGNYTPVNDFDFKKSTIPTIDRELSLKLNAVINWEDDSGKLTDSNITSATTQGYIPLSSPALAVGDQAIRLSNNIYESHTILQSLNSRVEVVCATGIGVEDNVGDFNGIYAIEDAINWYNSTGNGNDLVIYVKGGVYEFNNSVNVSNYNISLIGTSSSPNDVDSSVVLNVPGPGVYTFSFTNSVINIKNIQMINQSGDEIIGLINSILNAENCTFIGKLIQSLGTLNEEKPCVFKSCIFIGDGGSTYNLNAGSVGSCSGLEFRSCVFDNTINAGATSILRVSGSSASISSIIYEDCVINLGSYEPLSPPSGSYVLPHTLENTGLIELDPFTDGRTVSGLIIESIIYQRNTISAISPNGRNSIIQLCSAPTDLDAASYASPNPWATVKTLSFISDEFRVVLNDSSDWGVSFFAIGHGIDLLDMRDCEFNLSSTAPATGVYGYFPDWFSFTNPSINTTTSLPSSGIILGATDVYLDNIKINDIVNNTSPTISFSSSSDIYICNGRNLSILNLNVNANVIGTLGTGATRGSILEIFRESNNLSPIFSENPRVYINNASFCGSNIPNGDWFYHAIIFKDLVNATIGNSSISGFTTSAGVSTTFSYWMSVTGGYVSSSTNVQIYNNFAESIINGIGISGEIDNIVCNYNYIKPNSRDNGGSGDSSISTYGIIFTNSIPCTYVNISNNTVHDLVSTGVDPAVGVYIMDSNPLAIFPSTYSDNVSPSLFLCHNKVSVNNQFRDSFLLYPVPQIGRPIDKDPKGIVYGNVGFIDENAGFTPDYYPTFKIKYWDNSLGYQSIDSSSNDIVKEGKLFGVETDHFYDQWDDDTDNNVLINSTNTWVPMTPDISINNLPRGGSSISIKMDVLVESIDIDQWTPWMTVALRLVDGLGNIISDDHRTNVFSWKYIDPGAVGDPWFNTSIITNHDVSGESITLRLEALRSNLPFTGPDALIIRRRSLIRVKKRSYRDGQMMLHNNLMLST